MCPNNVPSKKGISLTLLFSSVFVSILACSTSKPTSSLNERPPCVTLLIYSSVIEQVMGVYPEWTPLHPTEMGYEAAWVSAFEDGAHQLVVTLTKNECVCSTSAFSRFPSGSSQAEFAGYLQGAAVAPLSDLDLTGSWLEPKLVLNCPLAFLLRKDYAASQSMPDGTIWQLECHRQGEPAFADLEYSFSVGTDLCPATLP